MLHQNRKASGPLLYLAQHWNSQEPPKQRAHLCPSRGGSCLPNDFFRSAPAKLRAQVRGSCIAQIGAVQPGDKALVCLDHNLRQRGQRTDGSP